MNMKKLNMLPAEKKHRGLELAKSTKCFEKPNRTF